MLLAGTCFGYPLLAIPTQPIPITFDRILWIVLMVQLFLWWRSGLTERSPIRRTELLLLALVGVLAVSIATHDWTVNRNLPLSRFLFYYLMPVGMYWVGRQARITECGMTTMFVILGAFGVYVALTAIAEAWGLESWIFPGTSFPKNARLSWAALEVRYLTPPPTACCWQCAWGAGS